MTDNTSVTHQQDGKDDASQWQLSENALWRLSSNDRRERLYFPWRRMLARGVDLCFYTLIWWAVAYYVFNWNVLLFGWVVRNCIMFAFSMVLMILLEPLMLSIFGTTPGKALFGMKLRTKDGARITIGQGYKRIFTVLSSACGYVIVPVYNFIRMYKICKMVQVTGVAEYDELANLQLIQSGRLFKVQVVSAFVFAALIAGLMVTVFFSNDMPRNRGNITAAQFEENLERHWHLHGSAWNTRLYLRVPLQFIEFHVGYIFDRMDPPEINIIETDGVITEIYFEIIDAPRSLMHVLPGWISAYAISFIGAQDSMNFYRMHARRGVLDTLLNPFHAINMRDGEGAVSFTAAGVEVDFTFYAGARVDVYFRMRKA